MDKEIKSILDFEELKKKRTVSCAKCLDAVINNFDAFEMEDGRLMLRCAKCGHEHILRFYTKDFSHSKTQAKS